MGGAAVGSAHPAPKTVAGVMMAAGLVGAALGAAHSAPTPGAWLITVAGWVGVGQGEGKDKGQALAKKGKVLYWADRMMYEYKGESLNFYHTKSSSP